MATQILVLQNQATGNGPGLAVPADGELSAQQMEIVETGGGTAIVTFEGSFAGSTWYSIGYQQIDATASLSRSVTGVTVSANSSHAYQLLDPYPQVRARLSSVAGGATVTVKGYLV